MSSTHSKIDSLLQKVAGRYDPEFDVPAAPQVTWADYDLLYAILEMAKELDSLHRRIAELEQRANE